MKLGIYLNSQHPAGDDPARRFAEAVEQVRLIRGLGFDSLWGGEHHATPGFHYFPLLPMIQRLGAAGHAAYRERASEEVLGRRWRGILERAA